MSLRVLLADESDTIKKVFQLALQDFQAEIKGVHSGLDVIDVALSFKPDIIFADVLLQKKNGYDTCLELKQHPVLKNTAVILMWSSFMELDQAQFKRSLANDQLEKPFDADFLRGLVKKYTSNAQQNPMASFLNFPKSITAELRAEDTASRKGKNLPERPAEANESEFNLGGKPPAPLDSPPSDAPSLFNELTNAAKETTRSVFQELRQETKSTGLPPAAPPERELTKSGAFIPPENNRSPLPSFSLPSLDNIIPQKPAATPPPPPAPAAKGPDENWMSTDLSKFKLNVDNPVNDNLDKFEALNLDDDDEKTDDFSQVAVQNLQEIISFEESMARPAPAAPPEEVSAFKPMTGSTTQAPSQLTSHGQPMKTQSGYVIKEGEIEAIVRAHTEEFIKTEIKHYLLETIEKIVREELNRILEEEVNLKQDMGNDKL